MAAEEAGAAEIAQALGMRPHPEGGWFVETWRGGGAPGTRPAGTAILYLLAAGQRSRWHRIDADEVWQFAAGEPLELRIWGPGEAAVSTYRVGSGVMAGEMLQVVVPAGAWQAARPLGRWTLVGCIVVPGFEFAGFELAPDGWEPPIG